MQTNCKAKTKKYIFQSPLLVFYLVLYSFWPILLLALWPLDMIMGLWDKSFALAMVGWVYSLPVFISSLIFIGVDYFNNACTAVYTFLTMNLLIFSVFISVAFK